MNTKHPPTELKSNAEGNASSDMQRALWQALLATAVITVVLKSLTGIVWFGALLVAMIVFSVSLGCILRIRRGFRS